MTKDFLDRNYIKSSYNKDEDRLDFYIQRISDTDNQAYLYSEETNSLTELEILKIVIRSDDVESYDGLSEKILLDMESRYNADCSAEFITDNDCCLVWFKYRRAYESI